MAASSFDNKNANRARKFTLESLPVYYVPAQQAPKQSPLRAMLLAHKIVAIALCCLVAIVLFRVWQSFAFIGLPNIVNWMHEIAAGILLVLTIILWAKFSKWHQIRKVAAIKNDQKMELTAIRSNVIMLSPQQAQETPLYVAAESLSIDYWVSRETMGIEEEDLAIGNLPDEYIAPDALVLSIHDGEIN